MTTTAKKFGRPTKLHHRIEVKDAGSEAQVVTVGERIVDLVARYGMTPSLAGREAGVTADAVWKWIRAGREHMQERDRGKPLYAEELALIDFVSNLDQARAVYLRDQLDLHEQIARGGLVIQEVVREVDPTELVPDPADPTGEKRMPKVLKSRTKSTRLLPDLKALQWNIERKSRQLADPVTGEIDTPDEGLGSRVEVTGADGGPVEVDDKRERAKSMLREIEALKAGAATAEQLHAERNGATQ